MGYLCTPKDYFQYFSCKLFPKLLTKRRVYALSPHSSLNLALQLTLTIHSLTPRPKPNHNHLPNLTLILIITVTFTHSFNQEPFDLNYISLICYLLLIVYCFVVVFQFSFKDFYQRLYCRLLVILHKCSFLNEFSFLFRPVSTFRLAIMDILLD